MYIPWEEAEDEIKLTAKQFASRKGIHHQNVYLLIKRGELDWTKESLKSRYKLVIYNDKAKRYEKRHNSGVPLREAGEFVPKSISPNPHTEKQRKILEELNLKHLIRR